MGAPDQPVADFVEAIGRSPDLWRSIDIRILAASVGGEWHNLLTRCYLGSPPPDSVTRLNELPVTAGVGCWQHVVPFDSLKSVLEAVQAGQLCVGDIGVNYLSMLAPESDQRYTFSGYTFSDLSERYRTSYRYWSCHTLTARGNDVQQMTNRVPGGRLVLDNSVRVFSAPFDGLDGLARFALGSPQALDVGVCLFEIFAPLEGLLLVERCRLEKGELHYAVRAGSEDAARHCKLGVFGVGEGPLPFRDSMVLPRDKWKASSQGLWIEGDLEVPQIQSATLILSIGPYAIHRATFGDIGAGGSNPRMEAYRAFDPNLEWLSESLICPGSRGSVPFERAVARLLTLAGFQVDLLAGVGELSEAVDAIVYAPGTGICIAVECTTASVGSEGKPGKLVARMGTIQRAAPDLEVWGLLATPLERSQISKGDIVTAEADRLIVLGREDLTELLVLSDQSAPLTEVLAYLRTKIPGKHPQVPQLRPKN